MKKLSKFKKIANYTLERLKQLNRKIDFVKVKNLCTTLTW